MHKFLLVLVSAISLSAGAQTSSEARPLRVAIVGLVHGHVSGFLGPALKRNDIEIVGISEPDEKLARRYAAEFKLDEKLFHRELEEMLTKVKPQALLVYTDTKSHRQVVEAAARHHVAVMMEKPLAVNVADALAMQRAADGARIPVLVNYETTWYASNRAAYDLVRDGGAG